MCFRIRVRNKNPVPRYVKPKHVSTLHHNIPVLTSWLGNITHQTLISLLVAKRRKTAKKEEKEEPWTTPQNTAELATVGHSWPQKITVMRMRSHEQYENGQH